MLCWTQLVAKSTMQWVPIVLNLMVHVPMYFYYAVRPALVSRPAWAPRRAAWECTHRSAAAASNANPVVATLGLTSVLPNNSSPPPRQLATLGIHVWWKKYLTTCQIIQFCIDVPACVVATVFKARRPPA